MEIVGLEPRRSDLARGIVIARGSRPLDATEQRALWEALGVAGVTEPSEADGDDDDDGRARQWLAAPWLPPAAHELDDQRAAFELAAATHGLETIWCVKVETGIDGVAWIDLAAAEGHPVVPAGEPAEAAPAEVVDAIFEQEAEVLYSAPDAPSDPALAPGGDDEDDEDDDDDEDTDVGDDLELTSDIALESHWRNGVPPLEHSVVFPIERYPEIIDDYDWESFGIALKLAGTGLPGEESVVNAFFALWLSVYQDERVDEFEPFQRADVVHDRKHRSALMWVERFTVPATAADQVHFLLWIVARIHDILPLLWARFDSVDDAVKSRATGGASNALPTSAPGGSSASGGMASAASGGGSAASSGASASSSAGALASSSGSASASGVGFASAATGSGVGSGNAPVSTGGSAIGVIEGPVARATAPAEEPFILAGNPLADRFRRQGEEAALAWAVQQSVWSRRELAGMLIEVALEHDPDDPATAVVAERLLRRALAFDGRSDASGYLAIVLVRQHRLAEAIALARTAPSRDVRLLVVGETAEHMPGELDAALDLLDPATLATTDPEELCDLVGSVARHAPAYLVALLARLPGDRALVPFLYNTSFSVERPQALAILRKVLALPVPPQGSGEARTALVMAWNNACIHAHALGDYALAVELADGGQPFGPENPYIYHSAACAYAAVGQIERALEQISRAIEHEYEHAEKMETDRDLAPLHGDPRFTALFSEWRTRRADLN
ncbi:MAG: tetratricopeptide repeat protein [Kofleriaceae bacterium]